MSSFYHTEEALGSHKICCPILCFPTYQKPQNIIRTLQLFDLFVAGLVMVPTLVELKSRKLILHRIAIFIFGLAMFIHALYMVMYYNRFVSRGNLIKKARIYYILRM